MINLPDAAETPQILSITGTTASVKPQLYLAGLRKLWAPWMLWPGAGDEPPRCKRQYDLANRLNCLYARLLMPATGT
jgi:hypothetical protein